MDDIETIRSAMIEKEQDRRRKRADWVMNMAKILTIVAWVAAIAVWFVLEAASPEREASFITSIMRVHFDSPTQIRTSWDETLLPIAFGLLMTALIICAAAFIFNMMRMRRKSDKHRKSLLILGCIAVFGNVVFLLRFGLPF